MKKSLTIVFVAMMALSIQACTGFIFRIDVPQGNYLEQKDVDKLRIGMTREQVEFVLGRPLVRDSFNQDVWYYVYKIKRGMSDEHVQKNMEVHFEDDKLAKVEGDFELHEDFNTPLEQ